MRWTEIWLCLWTVTCQWRATEPLHSDQDAVICTRRALTNQSVLVEGAVAGSLAPTTGVAMQAQVSKRHADSIRNVKVLLFSEHGGLVKDSAQELLLSGVPRENIYCLVTRYYAHVLQQEYALDADICTPPSWAMEVLTYLNRRFQRREAEYSDDQSIRMQWTVLEDQFFIEDFADRFRTRFEAFDVFWVDFPTIFGVFVANILDFAHTRKLWLRMTHRMDHETPWDGWERSLLLDLLRGTRADTKSSIILGDIEPILFTASEYDFWYTKYYTCLEPTRLLAVWPSVFQSTLGRYNPVKDLFVLWGGSDSTGYKSIENTFSEIMRVAAGRNLSFRVVTKREYRPGNFRHIGEFADVLGIVYFPYSVFSSAFSEIYACGIPMLVPSVPFVVNEFLKGGGIGQRTANNFACAPPSFPERCGGGGAGSLHDPNSCEAAALEEWIPRMDLAVTPHVLPFQSAVDAVDKMEALARDRAQLFFMHNGMRRYTSEQMGRNAATLQDALLDAFPADAAESDPD